ncbi:MAG: methylated-DNA--[protein]-cysteine S-methyltransferase [Pseudomonadota bacterium]
MIVCRRIDSPVGPLMLAADRDGLRYIEFRENRHPADHADWHGGDSPMLQAAEAQLGEYFAGTRKVFDLPLAPRGTDFQMTVWRALAHIPFGATSSYAQLAQRIGSPSAIRAVGAANGRNPLPIVLPCHRVIGTDGAMVGFGGGVAVKEFLLRLEGAMPEAPRGLF